jgi:hypothetical protein
MIGSMSGPFAGAIGEGMGDTLAIYYNRNDRVGEYSFNNSVGIRRFPYTNYPLTYGDLTGNSVHSDGEIYAATMWRLLEIWEDSGRTQESLFDSVIGGMNFTPARPAYEDMRDGILAAAPTQAEDCLVWQAFAEFGIGEGANGVETCRGFTCRASVTESFVVPSVCSAGGGNTAPSVSITAPANDASFVSGVSVTFAASATDSQDGPVSANLSWVSSRDGGIGSGASFSTSALTVGTHTITASVTDSGGLTGTASITVHVTTGGGSGITLSLAGRKVKGVNHVDLAWAGATAAVDIYRNGVKIVSATQNDGAHTDNTNTKGGGASFTYRVCEAGSTTCSADRTIVF